MEGVLERRWREYWRDFQMEKCKKEFLFCFLTRVFRERFDIAFGINLFLTKLLEGVGKVV